jgi:hypothetical protein
MQTNPHAHLGLHVRVQPLRAVRFEYLVELAQHVGLAHQCHQVRSTDPNCAPWPCFNNENPYQRPERGPRFGPTLCDLRDRVRAPAPSTAERKPPRVERPAAALGGGQPGGHQRDRPSSRLCRYESLDIGCQRRVFANHAECIKQAARCGLRGPGHYHSINHVGHRLRLAIIIFAVPGSASFQNTIAGK